MTRIIAGRARGRRLAVPPAGTRPTSDRAREGLFNALVSLLDLAGAQVLDLYAGTGAVGLEALSRGASAAVLVESDRAAVQVLRRNVTTVGLPGAVVRTGAVAAYLSDGHPGDGPFDLVFTDPPYGLADTQVATDLTALVPRLRPGAVVVVERSARGTAPGWPEGLEAVRDRRYGESRLWYGRRS